jgi:hypothetical protein
VSAPDDVANEDELDDGEDLEHDSGDFGAVAREGEVVFSVEWDSDAPGAGAGGHAVLRWRGKFYVMSDDLGDSGPSETLDDVLEDQDVSWVSTATTSVWSSMLTAEEVAARLHHGLDEDHEFEINDEPWAYRATVNRFVRLGDVEDVDPPEGS